jgi:hypothetical protein
MRGDSIIPVGKFKAACPQCGTDLDIKHDGINLEGEERMICPIHGDVGSLEERAGLFSKDRDKIIDPLRRCYRSSPR